MCSAVGVDFGLKGGDDEGIFEKNNLIDELGALSFLKHYMECTTIILFPAQRSKNTIDYVRIAALIFR